jgi:hypothetical protein
MLGVAMLTTDAAHAQTLSSSTHPIYRNRVYDFEVSVPPGVTYERTTPPAPDHGLLVTLNNQTQLWVDASYADSSSTEKEANRYIAGCRVEDKRSTLLGRLPAIMLRFSCDANAYSGAYREQLVLSVRLKKGRSPIRYQIVLRTNGATITPQEDELFRKLAAGFRFAK